MTTARVTAGVLWFPASLALVSFILLGIGVGQLSSARQLVDNAVEVPSTVISVEKRVSHSDVATYVQYVPTVTFVTKEGRERTAELPGSDKGRWVIGGTPRIIYNAADPWQAYPVGWTPLGPPTALLIVGCSFALLSIIVGFLVHRGVRAGATRAFR